MFHRLSGSFSCYNEDVPLSVTKQERKILSVLALLISGVRVANTK